MKKIFLLLLIGIVFLATAGVFAEAGDFSDDFQGFIQDIVEQRNLNETNITNITSVDFNDLPEKINLQNIDNTNLGLYQIDLADGSPPIYVITMADSKYEQYLSRPEDYKRMFLNFGYSGKMPDVGFLQTAVGVEGSLEKGYVMVRGGSITGLSTNLDITKADAVGQVDIILYRNGESIGFGNTLIASSTGVKTDHDVQSENTITFNAGDVISMYVDAQGNIDWQDVITSLEITTSE